MPIEKQELKKILESVGAGFKERNDKLTEEVNELSKKIDELIKKGVNLGTGAPTSDQSSSSQQPPQQSTSPSDSKNSDPEEIAWNSFFTTGKSITDPDQRKAWKVTSGLTSGEAQQVWDNGWRDLIANITNLGDKQVSYTKNNKTTANVELLKHEKEILDKVYSIMHDIEEATLPSDMLKDDGIESYDQKLVPESRSHESLKKMRDGKAKELFKKGFGSDISNDKIDAWIKAGLGGNGTNERKAFNNGWTEPEEISGGKLKADNTIDVLKHNKDEIKRANDIIEEIKATTTFKEIDDWKTNNETRVKELVDGKLPASKQKKGIWDILTNHRNTFKYRIDVENNETEGDGLGEAIWKKALTAEEDDWKVEERGKLDSGTLNKFLTDNGVELPLDNPNETNDMTEWLKSQGAFDTKDETADQVNLTWGSEKWKPDPVTVKVDEVEETIQPGDKLDGKQLEAIEESWDIKAKGSLKLPYSYNKAEWNPDKIFSPDDMTFCEWKEATIKVKKRVPVKDKRGDVVQVKGKGGKLVTKYEDKWEDWTGPVVNDSSLSNEDRQRIFGHPTKMPGHVPLVTGGGKTTKLVCDLTRGGEKLICVVCPNKGLAISASKHHSSWLQTWGCVNCKINPRKVVEEVVKKDEVTGQKTKEKVEVVRYDSHGAYQVKYNDVITSKLAMSDKDENGKDIPGTEKERWGISIFDPDYFFGFATRKLFTTKQKQGDKMVVGVSLLDKGKDGLMKKDDEKEIVPKVTSEMIDEIKNKKLPKNAIIIFDEAHLDNSAYQELVQDIIVSGYNVIKMSATFKGKEFSITTTFPRENLYMNYIPAKYEKDGKEVDFDKKLANSRTQVFLKDVNNVDVSALVKKNIPHVIINQTNEAVYESITHGMPDGSLIIVDNSREMGYTPKVEIVICSGWTQYPILENWIYTDPQPSRISIASVVQQIGRVARIDYGTAIILSKKLEEPTPKDDIAVFVIRAALLDNAEAKKRAGFSSKSVNINVLRGCICLPGDSEKKQGKFGLPPEVLVVGAMGMETPTYAKVKYHRSLTTFNPDTVLYAKHKLEWNPPPLNEKEAHEILKLMVQTYIEKDRDFPHQLRVKVVTSLIDELDQGQGKDKGPGKGEHKLTEEEVRKIFHTVIKNKLVEIDSELATNPNKTEWPVSQKDIFSKVVAVHRLVLGAEIGIPERSVDPDKPEGDKAKVVEVNYPKLTPAVKKKAIFELDEEEEKLMRKIRRVLEKENINNLKEVKEALKEDSLEGYEILAIELKTYPLCNRLVDEIGTNRANKLIFKLEKVIKKINLNEFKANIEVRR